MEVRLGYHTRGELEAALTQKSTTAIRPGDLAMWDEGTSSRVLTGGNVINGSLRWPRLVISVTARRDEMPAGSWRAGVLALEPNALHAKSINARFARPV